MLLVGAVLLAVFVLPRAWGVVLVVLAAAIEVAEIWVWIRLSRRGKVRAGAEALVGATGVAVTDCRPDGSVRVRGELWRARCDAGVGAGERIRITRLEGLTLTVEPAAEP